MEKEIFDILKRVYNNNLTPDEAIEYLKFLPYYNINHTKIDTHRNLRTSIEEVIFGENKKLEELLEIVDSYTLLKKSVLITRLSEEKAKKILDKYNSAVYHPNSKILVLNNKKKNLKGNIVVLAAGTSDIPVAEEAKLTAEFFGSNVKSIYDVGIAGLHRLIDFKDDINNANIIVAVAGMEGALPSVVAGIFGKPIVAVPTSVGYGANFKGIAPLLAMLNSCAPGVAVVNIDNGFGAGVYAHLINNAISKNWNQEFLL